MILKLSQRKQPQIIYLMKYALCYIMYRIVSYCIVFIWLVCMGIVKISEGLHEEVRKNSAVMERSINSQAEFWIKIGRLAEQNPTLTYEQILEREMRQKNVTTVKLVNE